MPPLPPVHRHVQLVCVCVAYERERFGSLDWPGSEVSVPKADELLAVNGILSLGSRLAP